eukprot:1603596-Pleurochrysis_carterae.AAC.4
MVTAVSQSNFLPKAIAAHLEAGHYNPYTYQTSEKSQWASPSVDASERSGRSPKCGGCLSALSVPRRCAETPSRWIHASSSAFPISSAAGHRARAHSNHKRSETNGPTARVKLAWAGRKVMSPCVLASSSVEAAAPIPRIANVAEILVLLPAFAR